MWFCMGQYVIQLLLELVLSRCLAGGPFLNKFSGRSDLLVSVGSQEESFIEVTHGKNVLLVLPVHGFAGGHRTSENTEPPQLRQITGKPKHLLVVNKVLRIQHSSQKLLVSLQDLTQRERESYHDAQVTSEVTSDPCVFTDLFLEELLDVRLEVVLLDALGLHHQAVMELTELLQDAGRRLHLGGGAIQTKRRGET